MFFLTFLPALSRESGRDKAWVPGPAGAGCYHFPAEPRPLLSRSRPVSPCGASVSDTLTAARRGCFPPPGPLSREKSSRFAFDRNASTGFRPLPTAGFGFCPFSPLFFPVLFSPLGRPCPDAAQALLLSSQGSNPAGPPSARSLPSLCFSSVPCETDTRSRGEQNGVPQRGRHPHPQSPRMCHHTWEGAFGHRCRVGKGTLSSVTGGSVCPVSF